MPAFAGVVGDQLPDHQATPDPIGPTSLLQRADGHVEGAAFVRLVYAEVLSARGNMDAARTEIGAARADVMSRSSKLQSAEWRARFLRDVPENARILELASLWAERT